MMQPVDVDFRGLLRMCGLRFDEVDSGCNGPIATVTMESSRNWA
jgi:hypothetical protein